MLEVIQSYKDCGYDILPGTMAQLRMLYEVWGDRLFELMEGYETPYGINMLARASKLHWWGEMKPGHYTLAVLRMHHIRTIALLGIPADELVG